MTLDLSSRIDDQFNDDSEDKDNNEEDEELPSSQTYVPLNGSCPGYDCTVGL